MVSKLTRLVFSSVAVITFFLLFSNVYLYVAQPNMLFYPLKDIEATPDDWQLPYESVSLKLTDDTHVSGWYLPHLQATKTLLFFHGNGGNISHRGNSLSVFHKLKLNVLIIDYPGYGKSEGAPSEKSLYQSANAAWEYLLSDKNIRPENIILFGRSLGGAVAVDLASRVKAGALILESTFTSVSDMADFIFPVFSRFIYLRYSFDSLNKITKITAPLLVIHSPDDEIIPFGLGKKLYKHATADKKFLQLEGGHNDGFIKSMSSYMKTLNHFIYTY